MKQILIVDDEPSNIRIMADYLHSCKEGYKIRTASDGKAALRVLEKIRPDLIISDWQMPQMDGLELLAELRKDHSMQEIPVIITTGVMTDAEDLALALESQAVDYLRKPLEKAELIARVRTTLALSDSYKKVVEQKKIIEEKQLEIEELHLREKKLLREQLNQKQHELHQMAMMMSKRNEILQQLQQRITLAMSMESFEVPKPENLLPQELNPEEEWLEFRLRIEQTYPTFFAKLRNSVPDLSSNEERLCTYLRVGVSNNKELAQLLAVSDSAVKKAKNRLSKKIGLESAGQLKNFVDKL